MGADASSALPFRCRGPEGGLPRCADSRVKVLTPLASIPSKAGIFLPGFHSRSQVRRNDFVVGFLLRNLHREGIQLPAWNMKHMAVPPQEDQCNSKGRSLVAVSKPLGTCESYQVGRSQIREISLGVVGPPVEGSSKRRAQSAGRGSSRASPR
jgi:hypothetical protein